VIQLTIGGTVSHHPEEDADKAMRLYWEAKSDGDATALIERVDRVPQLPPKTRSDATPTPRGTVSELARERIARQDESLAKAGFSVRPPIYAPGTRVVELGDENFRIERERVENLPRFPDAAECVVRAIEAENREDIEVPASSVKMLESGELLVEGTSLELERPAFQQLATLCSFGSGAKYLAEHCPADLRAMNVNRQLKGLRRRVTLRTREARGSRRVFAAVTPTYSPVDSDSVLRAITPDLKDAHAELRYDGTGIEATALFMPDEIVDLAAGDVFKIGVRASSNDTGRGRIRLSAVVWRNLCLNLIILDEAESATVNQVHRGSTDKILSSLEDGVLAAREKVSDFLEAWGHARSVRVNAKDELKRLVEERKLKLPGIRSAEKRDQVVEELLSAWSSEPDDSQAGVVNAITRAAHTVEWWNMDLREELERQAARLVKVPA